MCIKLRHTGKIVTPGSMITIHTPKIIKPLVWGKDFGYGIQANAKLESIEKGVWFKRGFEYGGFLEADSFFESNTEFMFKKKVRLGIIHNDYSFLLVTEPASSQVKRIHPRQPCFIQLTYLSQLVA